MACNTCQQTKSIPQCTTLLVLGTIAENTEVYIFVKNHTTGYIHRQEATSDEDGVLSLDLSLPDSSFYNPDSNYEVWATLRTTSQNTKLNISISAVNYTCFDLSFNSLYGEEDENISYPTHTLEIES